MQDVDARVMLEREEVHRNSSNSAGIETTVPYNDQIIITNTKAAPLFHTHKDDPHLIFILLTMAVLGIHVL